MLVVLFLPSSYRRSHQIEAEDEPEYIIIKTSSVIFVFKQFLIVLKQNLREEDNLSTRDKWPVPKMSSVQRFYCINSHAVTTHQYLAVLCM